MQLQFVVYLLEQNADDCATVTNHAATLSHLLDRYFGNPVKRRLPQAAERMPEPEGYLPNMDNGNFLNSAILETLPDRVAVLTRDYRYLYSNPANCTYLGRKPIDMIGRHVAEFIGPDRFAETKANFDACFAGERREYNYQRASAEGMKLIRCRMSPLRDSGGRVIGALVMMENVSAPEAVKTARLASIIEALAGEDLRHRLLDPGFPGLGLFRLGEVQEIGALPAGCQRFECRLQRRRAIDLCLKLLRYGKFIRALEIDLGAGAFDLGGLGDIGFQHILHA